jgi:hypothetical protein
VGRAEPQHEPSEPFESLSWGGSGSRQAAAASASGAERGGRIAIGGGYGNSSRSDVIVSGIRSVLAVRGFGGSGSRNRLNRYSCVTLECEYR